MEEINLIFPFEPVSKLRPRFSRCGRGVRTITPAKTAAFESRIIDYYRGVYKDFKFEKDVPLSVSIEFGLRIPQSASQKRKKEMLSGNLPHIKKPDIDNLTKAVLDALNNYAWHDDCQIVELKVLKKYVYSPNIYITVRPYKQQESGKNNNG